MATARRLYLYAVSAVALTLLMAGAVVMLRLILNKAGVGPASGGDSQADLDTIALAVALAVVGLLVWFVHWDLVERMVHGPSQPAAVERRSIVRSVFFALIMWTTMVFAADLGVDLLGRVVADVLGATSAYPVSLLGFGDDWSLSIIVVFTLVWAYHAWVRGRDVRRGPVIKGAAAWVSRFYLYYAALTGLLGVVEGLSALINTVGLQLAGQASLGDPVDSVGLPLLIGGSDSGWLRPAIAALSAVIVWGAIWLGHWLYSIRLGSGSNEQATDERASRVRLAFLMAVVVSGAITVVTAVGSGASELFESYLGLNSMLSVPLWYVTVLPVVAALPAGAAWWWHRRRAFAESAQGPLGVSAHRIAGYLVALVGLAVLASGIDEALSAVFGQWFASSPFDMSFYVGDPWKYGVAVGAGMAVVGALTWVWPWLFAEHRRRQVSGEGEAERNSSSRAYYLYAVVGASVLIVAVSLVQVLYRYLRLGFGLDESALGSEVAATFAALIVAGGLLVYHGWILRADRATPAPYAGAYGWPGIPVAGAAIPQPLPTPAEPVEPAKVVDPVAESGVLGDADSPAPDSAGTEADQANSAP